MAKKSVVSEAQEIQLAIELIKLGARLQLLESEVSLSRERLLKLYKELKGVSPPHVTLNQIFAGMMPYMLIVIVCLVFMYIWPGMTLWLPNFLYGGGGG